MQRWVTNCFRSTPMPILCAESCLPPLSALPRHKRRMATLRLPSSLTSINSASALLCRSFPSLRKARALHSHRPLCTPLAPNVMPLKWKTPLRSPPVLTNLPVDALAHHNIPLLKHLSYAPLINSTLLRNLPSRPREEVLTNAYCALKRRVPTLMIDHWHSLPLLSYYPYPLRLSPHPFMGLGKFMAGRIHLMCSQKGYLAGHPSWFHADDSRHCPLCGNEPETFSQAILRCPAKASAPARHLQGVPSVLHDAPLSSLPSMLLGLAAFISATGTVFPPDMPSSHPCSPVLMVFPSSPVGPPPVDLLALSPPRPLYVFYCAGCWIISSTFRKIV